MAPTATARKRPRTGKRRKARAGWLALAPLVLALAATPFAVRAASVLALSGPAALRLLYPTVVLVQSQASQLAPEQRDTLAQWMLWAQFPLYGLLASLIWRWRGVAAALGTVLALHALAVIVALSPAR